MILRQQETMLPTACITKHGPRPVSLTKVPRVFESVLVVKHA